MCIYIHPSLPQMKVKSFFRILGGFSQHGLLRRVKSLDTIAPVECNTRTLFAFVKENWERRHITSVSCSSEREARLPPEPFMLLGWTLRDSQQVRGIPWLSLCSCEFLISGRQWGGTGSHGLSLLPESDLQNYGARRQFPHAEFTKEKKIWAGTFTA